MKMVAIIVGVVVLLGAAGFAAYTFLGGEEGPAAPVQEAGDMPGFIALDPFTIPVIRGNEIVRQVNLVIMLELGPDVDEADVMEMMTFLRDAFIKRLHSVIGRRYGRREGQGFDAALVKRALLADSARVLGPGVIRDVLIQRSFENPSAP